VLSLNYNELCFIILSYCITIYNILIGKKNSQIFKTIDKISHIIYCFRLREKDGISILSKDRLIFRRLDKLQSELQHLDRMLSNLKKFNQDMWHAIRIYL
jgi:hypothetical protein